MHQRLPRRLRATGWRRTWVVATGGTFARWPEGSPTCADLLLTLTALRRRLASSRPGSEQLFGDRSGFLVGDIHDLGPGRMSQLDRDETARASRAGEGAS